MSFVSRLLTRVRSAPLLNNMQQMVTHQPTTAGLFNDPLYASLSLAAGSQNYTLPDLPYDYGALEPVISAEIMKLHHGKHHAGYVTNLNAALEKYAAAEGKKDISSMIALQSAIRFNGGGHINHSIFWTNLAPKNNQGGVAPSGELAQQINKEFGSLDNFINKFNTQTAAIQGSGWGWLGYDNSTGRLQVSTMSNQDPLAMTGLTPLLGIDVWEHAYYLQYKNARADYLKAIWQIVNWKNVEERYAAAVMK
jgi:Fe-Mn family superoxide dismutase